MQNTESPSPRTAIDEHRLAALDYAVRIINYFPPLPTDPETFARNATAEFLTAAQIIETYLRSGKIPQQGTPHEENCD